MMPDDFHKSEQVLLKKLKSYLGKIPSQDFNEEHYEVFLTVASPEELEEDILTKQTLQKIMKHFELD